MAEDSDDLLSFVSAMGGEKALRVEENLGEGFVRLRVSEAERRQAKHDIRCVEDAVIELLRNARDAGATHIYVATSREGNIRTTVVLDDGCGIPEDMHERIFEARVTSKLESVHVDHWGVHGRGMALFSIRENAESAEVVSSAPGLGSSIRVVTNADTLPERTDQSTWPQIGSDDDGQQNCVRGPHNIIRACCEFALEERGSCEVYLGSPAEIVATARDRVRPTVDASELLFMDSLDSLPVLERLQAASDAAELASVSASLGLEMSERTAHRIVAGQIRPQRSVIAKLTHAKSDNSSGSSVDLTRDQRSLRLSDADVGEFSRAMERDFSVLAQRYYLSLTSEPTIRVKGHRLVVTFDFEESD